MEKDLDVARQQLVRGEGSPEDLVQKLASSHRGAYDGEEQTLLIESLKFLRHNGADIRVERLPSDATSTSSLGAHIGGRLFFSVRRFLWDSLVGLIGLAASLYTMNPVGMFTSATSLLQKILDNISLLEPDSSEYQAYTEILTLFATSGGKEYPTDEDLVRSLAEPPTSLDATQVTKALQDLEKKHLIAQSKDGRYRPKW